MNCGRFPTTESTFDGIRRSVVSSLDLMNAEVDLTGATMDYEDRDVFPSGRPIAAAGYGNFWVLDETPDDAPAFFASHDPPAIVYLAPCVIVDLRNPAPGDGLSWGRLGPRTEARRRGLSRLFALAPSEKKQRRGLSRR